MKKSDCVFCNFEDKKILLYDDSLCYAIISKNPVNKHHVLVIPKDHYQDFIELPDELAAHIFIIAKKISKAIRKACKCDAISHLFDDDMSQSGYNLVAHFKFHIIPRFKKDMHVIDWNSLRSDESDEIRSEYAKDIKKYLN